MISLLCEIIAQSGRASAASFRDREGYAALLRSGLLQEAGIVQSVTCLECDTPHDADIVFKGGAYGYWRPEIGFVEVGRDELIELEPDLATLTTSLADAFDCKRRKSTPVHGATWRIGAIETAAGDLCLYLHPRMQGEADLRDVEAALRREMRSSFRLVLTAAGTLQVAACHTARLDDVAETDLESGRIRLLADPLAIVGAPLNRAAGRPSPFGDRLEAIVRSRAETGLALPGRNEEARAILDAFRKAFPNAQSPSLPTVQRAVTKTRGGS